MPSWPSQARPRPWPLESSGQGALPRLPTSRSWHLGHAGALPWLPGQDSAAQEGRAECPSPRAYLQVVKGQARALAAVPPALVVHPVQDGEAVQAVAGEGAQHPEQLGEGVASGGPGSQMHPSGPPAPHQAHLSAGRSGQLRHCPTVEAPEPAGGQAGQQPILWGPRRPLTFLRN